jgi:hypothetical protein
MFPVRYGQTYRVELTTNSARNCDSYINIPSSQTYTSYNHIQRTILISSLVDSNQMSEIPTPGCLTGFAVQAIWGRLHFLHALFGSVWRRHLISFQCTRWHASQTCWSGLNISSPSYGLRLCRLRRRTETFLPSKAPFISTLNVVSRLCFSTVAFPYTSVSEL